MLHSLKQSDINAVVDASAPGEPDSGTTTDPPPRERVYGLVERLSREAQEEMLALMWTGGPKNGSTFAENLELARKTRDENHASHIAEQHANLSKYLGDGLKRLSAEKA
jgi:hypothetical protein